MTIKYNVTGAERKRLALTIAKWLACEVKYLGAPTFAYEVDYFTITKDGSLSFDDRADSEVIERLLEHLYDEGFESECSGKETNESDEISGVCISVPKSEFTDTAIQNLKRITAVKDCLIKKALGTSELPIEITEDKILFPWFEVTPSSDELKTYEKFICALCDFAKNQTRINTSEKPVENEKYAFRCFLLRLGFIGKEYKNERKILLKNLEGSSAFKGGASDEISE